jgi:hypothetical protein
MVQPRGGDRDGRASQRAASRGSGGDCRLRSLRIGAAVGLFQRLLRRPGQRISNHV